MNTANLNTLIQRYEDNFEWINNAEHDEIFKWRAVRCFQDVLPARYCSYSSAFLLWSRLVILVLASSSV